MKRLSLRLPGEAAQSSTRTAIESSFQLDAPARPDHRLFVPLHHEAAYAYPLILWLHDDGNDASEVNQVMPAISDRNYLAVGIRGPKSLNDRGTQFGWSDTRNSLVTLAGHLDQVLASVFARYRVHPQRIIAAGSGRGGSAAVKLAMAEPNRFAGAVCVGGSINEPVVHDLERLRQRKLPILWQRFLKPGEETIPSSEIARIRPYGCRLDIEQFVGEGTICTEMLRRVDHWIMDNIVSSQAGGTSELSSVARQDSPLRWHLS